MTQFDIERFAELSHEAAEIAAVFKPGNDNLRSLNEATAGDPEFDEVRRLTYNRAAREQARYMPRLLALGARTMELPYEEIYPTQLCLEQEIAEAEAQLAAAEEIASRPLDAVNAYTARMSEEWGGNDQQEESYVKRRTVDIFEEGTAEQVEPLMRWQRLRQDLRELMLVWDEAAVDHIGWPVPLPPIPEKMPSSARQPLKKTDEDSNSGVTGEEFTQGEALERSKPSVRKHGSGKHPHSNRQASISTAQYLIARSGQMIASDNLGTHVYPGRVAPSRTIATLIGGPERKKFIHGLLAELGYRIVFGWCNKDGKRYRAYGIESLPSEPTKDTGLQEKIVIGEVTIVGLKEHMRNQGRVLTKTSR